MRTEAHCESAEEAIARNEKLAGEEQDTEKLKSDFFGALSKDDKSRKLYPERGGEPVKSSWWSALSSGAGREGSDKMKCEYNVYKVLQTSPLARIMMGALKASGCAVDIRRHFSCEVCDQTVTGGYDPVLNQVVICQNTARSTGMIQGVLTHEMIHMFDYCRRKLDLTDVKHLACTEIRAANLAHCSFLSAVSQGAATFVNIKKQHQNCVRKRAVASVLAVRNVSREEAEAAVDSVFTKCYNDLEPIGRRIRRNSDHMYKAYRERINLGYD
jgi:inner membrane protease ATP23